MSGWRPFAVNSVPPAVNSLPADSVIAAPFRHGEWQIGPLPSSKAVDLPICSLMMAEPLPEVDRRRLLEQLIPVRD